MQGGTGSRSEFEYQPDFAPDRYESGTLNAIGIFGLGAAAEHLLATGVEHDQARLAELTVRFRDGLSGVDGATMQGPSIRCGRRHRFAERRRRPVCNRRASDRRPVGSHDARRPPLLAGRAPQSRHGARGDDPLLLRRDHERRRDRRRRRCAQDDCPQTRARGRAGKDARLKWGGVVILHFGTYVRERANAAACRAASASCSRSARVSPGGVAVAFVWENQAEVERVDETRRSATGGFIPTASMTGLRHEKLITRKRAIVLVLVAAFISVIAGIGAVANSSTTAGVLTTATPGAAGSAPSSSWYWTMLVSQKDPNTLVLATDGLDRSSDGGKTLGVRRAQALQCDEHRAGRRRDGCRRCSVEDRARSSRRASAGDI